jgi:hypothetical protein
MEALVTEFFVELIDTPNSRACDVNLAMLDLEIWALKFEPRAIGALEVDFTKDEIWNAIKSYRQIKL